MRSLILSPSLGAFVLLGSTSLNGQTAPQHPVNPRLTPANLTVASGLAAGSVSGILLVTVTVPPGVSAGSAALVVSVGSASSPSGVTLAVQ